MRYRIYKRGEYRYMFWIMKGEREREREQREIRLMYNGGVVLSTRFEASI